MATQRANAGVLGVVAVVQLILHYLGWLGVVLGVIALLFGNPGRGFELIGVGFGTILLKFVIGFIFVGLLGMGRRERETLPRS